MEYNALTGYLAVLSELPLLEQVYLRHNNLKAHLNFLKTDMPGLLSIWLDGNDIIMTIPTEIGRLTDIRSISMAEAKLTGTIPTEVGLLTNLQRLWLYRNELTGIVPSELGELTHLELLKLEENDLEGTIPSKVCKAVDHSSYAKSAVAADCDKVFCECCTECP
jgi:Leucine-rich repeat (LRR) protein